MTRRFATGTLPVLLLASLSGGIALAQRGAGQPNILVIFGDDIGISNISAYSDGLMGYTTPHIDRVAKEGMRFLHYYGEQVVQFAATFKEFPPRSIPPSFNPTTIMEETINDIRDAKKRAAEAQKPKE